MKINKNNFKKWEKSKDELIKFLNKQSLSLPSDWLLEDHVLLVMETAITQYFSSGYNKEQIKSEIDLLLLKLDKNNKSKLN
jgi:hypothetical protein